MAIVNESDFDYIKKQNLLYEKIDNFNNIYRFGKYDPYNALTNTREYLFFVKPDLNILGEDGNIGTSGNKYKKAIYHTNSYLASIPYFTKLAKDRKDVIYQLQSSAPKRKTEDYCPFSLLLSNNVISNLDVPSLSPTTNVETPKNIFGNSYEYRGSSEANDDNFEFSLEFRDNKYLDVYNFFKAYEEYETIKHHGLVAPRFEHIKNKTIHDQIGIYKFMVDEDMQTIIYYAYYCGVMFKSLPRDVFSNTTFDNGLSFTVDMKAAFVEDMNPLIIYDFNRLVEGYSANFKNILTVHDFDNGGINAKEAKCPFIDTKKDSYGRYKLKWKG